MSNVPEMTPAEFDLMKVLWRLERATVHDVLADRRDRGEPEAAYTTVMTLLSRLAGKAAVAVDKSRQPFVYTPALSRRAVLRARLRDFVKVVFDGRADSLVLQLIEDEDLSVEELAGLEREVDEAEDEPK